MTKNIGFKFNIGLFILFIIGVVLLWIIGDILISTVITHTGFVFSFARDILMPLIIAVPAAALTQLLKAD